MRNIQVTGSHQCLIHTGKIFLLGGSMKNFMTLLQKGGCTKNYYLQEGGQRKFNAKGGGVCEKFPNFFGFRPIPPPSILNEHSLRTMKRNWNWFIIFTTFPCVLLILLYMFNDCLGLHLSRFLTAVLNMSL